MNFINNVENETVPMCAPNMIMKFVREPNDTCPIMSPCKKTTWKTQVQRLRHPVVLSQEAIMKFQVRNHFFVKKEI